MLVRQPASGETNRHLNSYYDRHPRNLSVYGGAGTAMLLGNFEAMSDENTAAQYGLPTVIRVLVCVFLAAIAVEAILHLDFKQPFIGYGLGGAFPLFLAARPGLARVALDGWPSDASVFTAC